MSAFMIIILILAGAFVPAETNQFKFETADDEIVYIRLAESKWSMYGYGTAVSINEFEIIMSHNGEAITIDTQKVLGVNSIEEFKSLKEFTMQKSTYKLEKGLNKIIVFGDSQKATLSW